MAIPLEIRLTEHEFTINASAVPYGLAMSSEIEFAFLVEIDGELQIMTPYEFACHDASCRPPTSGGTGGSKSNGGPGSSKTYAPKSGHVGENENAKDVSVVSKKVAGGVRSDGILSEPWLNEKGDVVLTPKQEKGAADKLKALGSSEAEWTANLHAIATRAMESNPKQAVKDGQWYQDEHDKWGAPLAKEHGVTVDQVMGIAAATSTNKTWDGVKNSNKEVVGSILRILMPIRLLEMAAALLLS